MKKFRYLYLFLMISAISLTLSSCSYVKGVKLSYKFTPGKNSKYVSTANTEVKFTIKDAPAGFPMLRDIEKNNRRITQIFNQSEEIESFNGNIAKIIIKKAPKEVKAYRGKTELKVSKRSFLPRTYVLEMNKSGRIEKFLIRDYEKVRNARASSKFLMQNILPDKIVKPGAIWTENVKSSLPLDRIMPGVIIEGPIEYKFQGIKKIQGIKCAEISYEGNLTPKKEDNKIGSADIHGKLYFDIEQGQIFSYNKKLNMILELAISKNISKNIETKTPKLVVNATLNLESKRK